MPSVNGKLSSSPVPIPTTETPTTVSPVTHLPAIISTAAAAITTKSIIATSTTSSQPSSSSSAAAQFSALGFQTQGPPSFVQVLLPFLPILALALLVLVLVRLLLRQCQTCLVLRLKMSHLRGPTHSQSQASTGEPPSPVPSNEVAPWTTEPCIPLFLLQQPELFFPFAGYVDPADAFWLDQPSMTAPIPPKYEDAIKMQLAAAPSSRSSPALQPLCIPSLQARAVQQLTQIVVERSPPPCYYEQSGEMPTTQQEQLAADTLVPTLAPRRNGEREHPPAYGTSSAAGGIDSLLPSTIANANGSSGDGLSLAAMVPPAEERPCSSCSLASFASSNFSSESSAAGNRKPTIGVDTFLPKSRQQQRRESSSNRCSPNLSPSSGSRRQFI